MCCCVSFNPNFVSSAAAAAAAVDPLINFRWSKSQTKSATDVASASASDVVVVLPVTPHCFVFEREVRDVMIEVDDDRGGGG